MEIIKRIQTLIKKPIVKELQQIGVIAGGSVVYAHFPDIKKEHVGDVDVFVNTKVQFARVCRHVVRLYPDARFHVHRNHRDKISVTTVVLPDGSHAIQVVLQKFDTPFDLLNSFDIDYVGCGVYQGREYMTDDCRIAHLNRQVIKTWGKIKYRRAIKAANKGFRIKPCIYGGTEPSDSEQIELDLDQILSKLSFLDSYIQTKGKIIDTSRFEVATWGKPELRNLRNRNLYPIDFKFHNGEDEMDCRYIPLKIRVIKCFDNDEELRMKRVFFVKSDLVYKLVDDNRILPADTKETTVIVRGVDCDNSRHRDRRIASRLTFKIVGYHHNFEQFPIRVENFRCINPMSVFESYCNHALHDCIDSEDEEEKEQTRRYHWKQKMLRKYHELDDSNILVEELENGMINIFI